MFRPLLALLLAGALASLRPAAAQTQTEDAALPGFVNSAAQLGGRTALQGSRLAAGAYWHNNSQGAVYVFDHDGSSWGGATILQALDNDHVDHLGYWVDLDGDYVVGGAHGDDGAGTNAGAAYVFYDDPSSGWAQQQKLTASDAASSDRFGTGFAISGSRIVVGAHENDTGAGSNAGRAYVFERSGTTWTEIAVIDPDSPSAGAHFGFRVALEGDRLAVSAVGENTVYVFDNGGGTWTQTAALTPSDGRSDFGYAVALDGDRLVVGAVGGTGAVYVYEYAGGTWSEADMLTASDGAGGDNFGYDADLAGDHLVVGANGVQKAYYYYLDPAFGWTEQPRFDVTTGSSGIGFGSAVSASGSTAVVGAPYTAGNDGALYVYSLGAVPIVCDAPAWDGAAVPAGDGNDYLRLTASCGLDYVEFWNTRNLSVDGVFLSGDGGSTFTPAADYTAYTTGACNVAEPALESCTGYAVDGGAQAEELWVRVSSPGSGPSNFFLAMYDGATTTNIDPVLEADDDATLPEAIAVESVYPNPFNPQTRIAFVLPEASEATLAVYDVLGRRVAVLVNGVLGAGRHVAAWDGLDAAGGAVPSGTYLVRLTAAGAESTRKVTLLK